VIRSICLDGVEYTRVGLLVLPVVDLTDEELDGLLTDAEPVHSAARDTRQIAEAP
jgi:hypothetical protein